MGVDLREIVNPRKLKLEELSDRVIAIDAYNALYQFLAIIRGESGEYLTDKNGIITSQLSGLFYRNLNLLSIGANPIYVFDGKPPALKLAEIARRQAVKKEAVIRYRTALSEGRVKEAKKYAQATSTLKDYMVDDSKRLLNLLGIPWIDAPSEGEATAAYLTTIGAATDAASQDYDSLLFGSKRLLRNVTVSGKRKLPGRPVFVNVEPEEVRLDQLLQNLGITREQLVDIGILLGTDFNPNGFKGIGPARALKFIKTHDKIEEIPQIHEELERIDIEPIRKEFLEPRIINVREFKWEQIDREGLITFLCDERAFSTARVENALKKTLISQASKLENLDKWFQ